MQEVVARWTGTKARFEVEAGEHLVVIDSHVPLGDDAGPTPTQMLLGALGGCIGINAVLLLKKYRQPYRSLALRVAGEQEPDWPRRFTGIDVTFEIEWEGEFDESLVARALDDAVNRYCPVDATLTRGVQVSVHRSDRMASPTP